MTHAGLGSLPCGSPRNGFRSERGTSLVDALIALSIVVTTITGMAHVLLWSRRAVWSSGAASLATALAAQKLEQLRALSWHVVGRGLVVSDVTTNLAVDPPSAGGSGLLPAPIGALDANLDGFVDYLDAAGTWRGTGPDPPPDAAYIRRWAIVPQTADPLHTLALHVVCFPVVDEGGGDGPRSPRAVHLTTVKTRTVP
jgi:hypothetical protein